MQKLKMDNRVLKLIISVVISAVCVAANAWVDPKYNEEIVPGKSPGCWKYSIEGEDGDIYFGVYGEDFEYAASFHEGERISSVIFINPKNGPHFVIPETYKSQKSDQVFDVLRIGSPGFRWCKGPITVTLNKNIREISFPNISNAYFFVPSENPYFSSCDGSLYIKYDGERYGWLANYGTEIDENFRFLPQTKGIGKFEGEIEGKLVKFEDHSSIRSNYLSSFTIPSQISYIGDYALSINTPYLIVEGSPYISEKAFDNIRSLRQFDLKSGDTLPTNFLRRAAQLVKVRLPEGLKIIEEDVFRHVDPYYSDVPSNQGKVGIMYFDLPNVTLIKEKGLGKAQAIKLGHGLEKNTKIVLERSWQTVDPSIPLHVCICTSEIPERSNGSFFLPSKRLWNLYVPEYAVEAYKADRYWGGFYNVEPIRDMLIPLISEPELTLEMGDTHKYLWDVMPLGNAVPEETGVWSSLNPKVAIVDQNGRLTAYTAGKTDIVFTLKDTDGNEYTAVSKVTVNYPAGVDEVIAEEDPEVDNQGHIQSIPDGVYNMHGQRVADSTDGLTSGLYIVRANGKTTKTMIR